MRVAIFFGTVLGVASMGRAQSSVFFKDRALFSTLNMMDHDGWPQAIKVRMLYGPLGGLSQLRVHL